MDNQYNSNNDNDNQNENPSAAERGNTADSSVNSEDIGELKRQIERIYEQIHQTNESIDFAVKSMKDIKGGIDEQNPILKELNINDKIEDIDKSIKGLMDEYPGKDMFSNISDTLKAIKDSIDKVTDKDANGINDISIHLDAITETLSILQESNEHLKNMKNTFEEESNNIQVKMSESSENIAEKIDKLSGLLEKQSDSISNIAESNKEFLDKSLSKMEEFISKVNESIDKTNQIYEFEKQMSEKREEEFNIIKAKHYNEKGLILFYRGVFSAALDQFFKALELNEDSPEILNNIGQTYLKMKEYDKAEEHFKKAIEIFPDFAECYNNLGLLYMDNKKYELAIENMNKAISHYSDFAEAYLNLGNAYKQLDQVEKAVENWQKAVEIDPFNEGAKKNLKLYKEGDVNV